MDLKKVHQIVNQFQKNIFKNSTHIDSGFFKSSFKGAGLQFKEHQIYNYGDEVRFIDWKLLARKNIAYIKTFEEERNVNVKVIIECCSNLILSHDGKSKFINILEMMAALILFAGKTKDSISIYFIGKKTIFLEKLNGENGILKMITILSSEGLVDDEGKPNIHNIFNFSINNFQDVFFRKLFEIKNGPFIVFSQYKFNQYEFFLKILGNKNTHFFELKCPFELECSRYKFVSTGLRVIKKMNEYEKEHNNKKIIKIDISKAPLLNFVSGLMSSETRI